RDRLSPLTLVRTEKSYYIIRVYFLIMESEENENAANINLRHLMACRCDFIFLLLEDRLIRF
ncbi:hypothetical protein, partial [Cyclobacterium amurskyense]|uniref:hypothetical protein n=1 Tax=Cyclobacterium amurskyense TaxID=320787 RepID=UPI0030DB21BA